LSRLSALSRRARCGPKTCICRASSCTASCWARATRVSPLRRRARARVCACLHAR
jgi:hypothetical protein